MGAAEGFIVGPAVGWPEGAREGFAVGRSVGNVGIAVGALVGVSGVAGKEAPGKSPVKIPIGCVACCSASRHLPRVGWHWSSPSDSAPAATLTSTF